MDEDVGAGVGPSERAHDAGGAGPTPERRRRMSARRKQDAVLRLLRGEDLELLSRQLGVTAADLSGWRARLPGRWRGVVEDPACRRSGRRDRPSQGEGGRSDDGQRAARGQDRAAGDQPPFGTEEVEAMSRRVSPSTDQVYGLQRVTRIWGVSRATVYRHRHRRRRSSAGGPGRSVRWRTRSWCGRSGSSCRTARSMARATASCGRGCASPASAPAGAASCG